MESKKPLQGSSFFDSIGSASALMNAGNRLFSFLFGCRVRLCASPLIRCSDFRASTLHRVGFQCRLDRLVDVLEPYELERVAGAFRDVVVVALVAGREHNPR